MANHSIKSNRSAYSEYREHKLTKKPMDQIMIIEL